MNEPGRPGQFMPAEYGHLVNPYDYLPLLSGGPEGRNERYNQRQMKQLVDEMRFKEKMEAIDRKKGKYKRSTNNCHKKYIGIIKNLVCLKLCIQAKEDMLGRFFQYRNSRVYYFIILCFLKWYLSPADIQWVFEHFCLEVSNKIERYQMEINTTSNANFIHFRRDEIIEMQFSIKSIHLFLTGNEEESMRLLYQKNKYIIIKKNEYLKTLQIIRQLREELQRSFEEIDIHKKEKELKLDNNYIFRQQETQNYAPYTLPEPEWRRPPQEFYPYNLKQERFSYKEQSDSEQIEHPSELKPLKQPLVKQEEGQNTSNCPLAGLQNSYPVMDYVNWHSWLITKQKRLQFFVKSKEEKIQELGSYSSLK